MVRYADDFVVLARYQGTRLTGWGENPGGETERPCAAATRAIPRIRSTSASLRIWRITNTQR